MEIGASSSPVVTPGEQLRQITINAGTKVVSQRCTVSYRVVDQCRYERARSCVPPTGSKVSIGQSMHSRSSSSRPWAAGGLEVG